MFSEDPDGLKKKRKGEKDPEHIQDGLKTLTFLFFSVNLK